MRGNHHLGSTTDVILAFVGNTTSWLFAFISQDFMWVAAGCASISTAIYFLTKAAISIRREFRGEKPKD